jgi:peptide methionine sulfoxide reductase msrA/msrB
VTRSFRRAAGILLVTALMMLFWIRVAGCSPSRSAGVAVRSGPVTVISELVKGPGMKTVYLAGGCFWGIQKYLDQIRGVEATEVGYANGASASATYGDGSGYAEAVRVDYDPDVAPLAFLLREFYKAIDPTSKDRQGNDVGTEYRSGIYYTDPADRPIMEASLAELQTHVRGQVAIEAGPLNNYTRAEDYHQKYLQKKPGGYCHIPRDLFSQAAAALPDPSDAAGDAKGERDRE